ncbi:uncharacterized protein LOC130433921 [Triplophysa dalaica]|uniref:uncharacterized protein LOC130433911 n=1 Tax=Triplophysa dalaica TaxID=1582913 RepID=UPI0024E01A57|nr:uncharacterized protein LOC130433911 [Triplophysa dalaica]XP_056619701.1 uncharacterized protein LOC130433921 [Triplophysa dalaica]
MSLFSDFIDLLRCLFSFCLSDQVSTELDEEESFKDAASGADKCNEIEDTSENEKSSENEEKKEMSSLLKMPSLPEPILVKEASDPPTPPFTEINALPSAGPVIFNRVLPNSTLPADKIRPMFRPQLSAGEPVRFYRTSRHFQPLPTIEESSLGDRIFPESVAPAGRIQTLPSVKAPLLVCENPTAVSDEVMYLLSCSSVPSEELDLMIQVDHGIQILPRSSSTLLFDLEDIEIENEYVKYTGRTIGPGEMKTSQNKALVAEIKHPPLKAIGKCWMENDSEDQKPVPPIQMEKVQDITDTHENDSESYSSSSKMETDVAPQKPRDRKTRLFHVNPSCRPKTETQQLKTSSSLCEWVEQKIRKRDEKKRRKEKMLLERQQLHERYLHDPKLKHLWVNKHNRFNRSVHDEV